MFMLKSTHQRILDRRDNQAKAAFIQERDRAKTSGRLATELLKERDAARAALAEIAAMETPASASIGRRMAARARQELPSKPGSAAVRAAMEAA
jgi:hypothetical protein